MKKEKKEEGLTIDEALKAMDEIEGQSGANIGTFFSDFFFIALIIVAFAINPILGIIAVVWAYSNR